MPKNIPSEYSMPRSVFEESFSALFILSNSCSTFSTAPLKSFHPDHSINIDHGLPKVRFV